MPQYVGFSSKDACQPRGTNSQLNRVMGLGEFATGLPNGFGSPGQPVIRGKKFVLTDAQLVIQDFINALNIPLGSKVGQPDYGTTLWNFVFDPNTLDVQIAIENEVRRVASEDPRIDINIIKAFPQDLGILVEVQMSVVPFNNPSTVSLFLNQQTTQATLAGV